MQSKLFLLKIIIIYYFFVLLFYLSSLRFFWETLSLLVFFYRYEPVKPSRAGTIVMPARVKMPFASFWLFLALTIAMSSTFLSCGATVDGERDGGNCHFPQTAWEERDYHLLISRTHVYKALLYTQKQLIWAKFYNQSVSGQTGFKNAFYHSLMFWCLCGFSSIMWQCKWKINHCKTERSWKS